MKVFIRQPFTESDQNTQQIIQKSMDTLGSLKDEFKLNFLTPLQAQSSSSFKPFFEAEYGLSFTPKNFRNHRFGLIDQADAFVVLRTGLSESGAFEVAYNIFESKKSPIFYAVWDKAPIKTTLLQDLETLCPVTYVKFGSPEELREPLKKYFTSLSQKNSQKPNQNKGGSNAHSL